MATPIQHTSQFIPTDLGVLERNLAATQQRADSAVHGLLQADAQFGSTIAANQDLKAKQDVIKNFKDRSKEVLQRYGGDPAKASKELAKEVVKAGNDPFWQINKAKQKGIEQVNQMRAQWGSDYLEGRDPSKIAIKDPNTGEYTSPEMFNPIAYNYAKLNQGLDQTFEGYKTQLHESLMKNLGPDGVLTATTIKGITNDKIGEVTELMYRQLKDNAPLANDQQLRDLAKNKAATYVQGEVRSFMGQPGFGVKEEPKYQDLSRSFTEIGAVSDSDTTPVSGIQSDFLEADKKLKELTIKMSGLQYATELGGKLSENDQRNLKAYEEKFDRLQKKRQAVVDKATSEYPIFTYLIEEEGLPISEALGATEKIAKVIQSTGVFSGNHYPRDRETIKPKILRQFTGTAANETFILKDTPKGEVKVNRPGIQTGNMRYKNVAETLSGLEGDIEDIGIDYSKGQIVIDSYEKSVFGRKRGGNIKYRVPFKAIKDQGLKEALTSVSVFTEGYSGKLGPGIFALGASDRPIYISKVEYTGNPEQPFDRFIYKTMGYKPDGTPLVSNEPVTIQDVMKDINNNLFDYFGGEGEYQAPKIKATTE